MRTVLACILILLLPLHLWRALYPASDWAALMLLPLFLMMATGGYILTTNRRRAMLSAVLHDASWLNGWLRGRVLALISALIISIITLTLLAQKSLFAPLLEQVLLVLLCLTTFMIFPLLSAWLTRHAQPDYRPWLTARLAGTGIALLFFPLYAWLTWAYTPLPGHLRTMPFTDALLQNLTALPDRAGWATELLSVTSTLEHAKLWLLVNLGNHPLLLAAYVLYSATVCLLIAHSSATIAAACSRLTKP